MKKLLLIAFMAIAMMGCSNDDETPTPEFSIVGDWEMTNYDIKYYDSNNTLIFEEDLKNDPDVVSEISVTGSNIEFTNNNMTTDNSVYNITHVSGKYYLYFNNPNITDADKIEVSIPTANTLTWYAELEDVEYGGDNGVPSGTAAKAQLKIQFVKN